MATLFIDQAVKYLLDSLSIGDVYAQHAPEEARPPFVTFQRISGRKFRDINGPSGLSQATIQIDVFSDDHLVALQISDSIRILLDGYRDTVTIAPDSIRIAGVSFQEERDFIESNTDPELYRASVDYLFTYEEDI